MSKMSKNHQITWQREVKRETNCSRKSRERRLHCECGIQTRPTKILHGDKSNGTKKY